MGSKISFSRGSSDQNPVDQLAPAASHPHQTIHNASDCKQMPEDKRCSEEDLDSRWGEELNHPASESHSSGFVETDGRVNFETAGGTLNQHSGHILPQEACPLLSNHTGCGEGAETDKQVGINTDKQEAGTDERTCHLSLQSGGEQQTEPEVIPSKRLNVHARGQL
ncbi:hypothetical protein CesoFtcFv8_012923 [Champsocephalus esox]|uniref:Uncharacterized protein n=1 Tax=Champsocephalus esox TaxID=159716 RepID=A0AAN8BWU6_9TELE|nr:hypothetical protein CesoFtcFv8_012923 [Champsocephalus esox]